MTRPTVLALCAAVAALAAATPLAAQIQAQGPARPVFTPRPFAPTPGFRRLQPPSGGPAPSEAAPSGVLVCVASGRQRIDIDYDYSSPSFGVYVGSQNTMTWIPSRDVVRLQFNQTGQPASAGVPPGFCAFTDRPLGPGDPLEVTWPVDPREMTYGQVNGAPVLIPTGSGVDALLTAGTRATFSVTLKEEAMVKGRFSWWSEGGPTVGP